MFWKKRIVVKNLWHSKDEIPMNRRPLVFKDYKVNHSDCYQTVAVYYGDNYKPLSEWAYIDELVEFYNERLERK